MHTRIACGPISVELDPTHGRILTVEDGRRGIRLIGEPALAENFRLLLPLPDQRAHYIRGDRQKLTSLTTGDRHAELVWTGLETPRGRFDVEYRLRIDVEDDAVLFRSTVVNRSEHAVEEVFTPVLGGMANPAERHDWNLIHATWGGAGREWRFYDQCQNVYLGPEDPTGHVPYPGAAMPWLDLYHARDGKGVYFCPEDPSPRFGAWMFQLRPGADWRRGWVWPDAEALGQSVGMAMAWVNIVRLEPGQTFRSAPVAVRFHDGGWHAAARLYRKWFDRHFPIDRRGQWLDREDAWQSTIISYPDDTVGYRFADLPRLAQAALSAGIRVLQIDGWDIGGLDRSFPDYRPDPRLGTPDELRQALAACRDMGVRTLLFSNLQVAHIDTDWFHRELHRYTWRDPRNDPGDTMGWEYNTVAGQVAGTKTRMRNCNPAHGPFADLLLDAYRSIAEVGADGTQVDKVGCGVATPDGRPDYHPDLHHIPLELTGTQPILDLFARHAEAARAVNPEFCIASETHWDRLIPHVGASYARHWAEDAPQIVAATFPELRQTCCITGPTDYALVANCIRFGHIINVEARCLHGSCDDAPRLAGFVAAALRLRRSMFDLLWDSQLIDPAEAGVEAGPAVKFCLHASRVRPGGQALVLNHFERTPRTARVGFPHRPTASATVHTVREPSYRVALPAEIEIPPDDLCVVVPD